MRIRVLTSSLTSALQELWLFIEMPRASPDGTMGMRVLRKEDVPTMEVISKWLR
jgi:hypothetical protein